MPVDADAATSRSGAGPRPAEVEEDVSKILPIELVKSQTIPPAPNRRKSAIDWLPDFGGFSWIAYGASSLVVICHCPSSLSPPESQMGPFFMQVIEPPASELGDWDMEAKAVAWSPVRPSDGQVAVGIGTQIRIYSPGTKTGSLIWRQLVCLVQSFAVEAIEWTGSGDGLITAGIEVVLWKRMMTSWDIACTIRTDIPQSIVSATWSIDGPVASASTNQSVNFHGIISGDMSVLYEEASRCVSIWQDNGRSGITKVELSHPQPILTVQWRPHNLMRSNINVLNLQRYILLTSCLDGAVRFWSEVDGGKVKKSFRDIHDPKAARKSYYVVAIIEVSQCLKATIGMDVFMFWGSEIYGAVQDEFNFCSSAEIYEDNPVGHCEWLVVVGPGLTLTLWAIHGLDDISPLCFPRATLWRKHDLIDERKNNLGIVEDSNSKGSPVPIKALISRNQLSCLPVACSLLQLSSDNTLSWLELKNSSPIHADNRPSALMAEAESTSCCKGGVQTLGGHRGTIVQVVVHPSYHEAEIAASLDSNGLLLFWSTSAILTCTLGVETLFYPPWKLIGSISSRDLPWGAEYSNLTWAPPVFNDDRFLLMCHSKGIDCLLIRISSKETERILCHQLFTISFSDKNCRAASYQIYATPHASSYTHSLAYDKFRLFAVCITDFQVLSWEIIMQRFDLSESTHKSGPDSTDSFSKADTYESFFMSSTYRVTVNSFLSNFSFSEQVTSVAVTSLHDSMPAIKWSQEMCTFSCHILTGSFDGTLRIWKLPNANSTVPSETAALSWKLMGMLTAHQGPINAISLSHCGKLATVSVSNLNSVSELHIWGSMSLLDGGCFLLEDRVKLDGPVISLNWIELGNGMLLLGVCTHKDLHIFSQRRCDDSVIINSDDPVEVLNWFCIARCQISPTIKGFLWGPKATPIILHEKHLSLFSHWFRKAKIKYQEEFLFESKKISPITFVSKINQDLVKQIDCCGYNVKESVAGYDCNLWKLTQKADDNLIRSCNRHNPHSSNFQETFSSVHNSGLHNLLKTVEKLCGSLPLYHPRALFLDLCSGHWKRAYVIVEHLVKYLSCDKASSTTAREKNSEKMHIVHIPEIILDKYFEGNSASNAHSKGLTWGYDTPTPSQFPANIFHPIGSAEIFSTSFSSHTSHKSEFKHFIEILENTDRIPFLSALERTQTLAVVDFLQECCDAHCSSAYQSFDEPGRRYWVAAKFQQAYFHRKFGRSAATDELIFESANSAWAFHSDCQENLYNSVISSEPSWLEMRNIGFGYWFINEAQLRLKMEKLARAKYLLKKDPKDSALLYLALNRLHVLVGLFKISKDQKDKALVGFLSRNFQEEKNKSAALKNAYVLMGRHQVELAIAFFLLGGDTTSAVMVCAKNLGDEQLALVMCRLIEGYGGPLERHLISSVLLPNAIQKEDFWLCSLFEWTLENYTESIEHVANNFLSSKIKMLTPNNRAAFSDPSVGLYCTMLASKSKIRNTIGNQMASLILKWATSMAANALNRCGLPLKALELISSSPLSASVKDHCDSLCTEKYRRLYEYLNPFSIDSCNWLLGGIVCQLEYNVCLNTAMLYISRLLKEHPCWEEYELTLPLVPCRDLYTDQDEELADKFKYKMKTTISMFKQKYSLKSIDIVNMILIFLHRNGLVFNGYNLLYECVEYMDGESCKVNRFPCIPRMVLKVSEEMSHFLPRYMLYQNFIDWILIMHREYRFGGNTCNQYCSWDTSVINFIYIIRAVKAFLKVHGNNLFQDDQCSESLVVLDHLELYASFSSSWLRRNLRELVMMIHTFCTDSEKSQPDSFMNLISKGEMGVQDVSTDIITAEGRQHHHEKSGKNDLQFEIKTWMFLGICLWGLLYNYSKHNLSLLIAKDAEGIHNIAEPMEKSNYFRAKLLLKCLKCTFSALKKQLFLLTQQHIKENFPGQPHLQNKEFRHFEHYALHSFLKQESERLQDRNESQKSLILFLSELSLSEEVQKMFLHEEFIFFKLRKQKVHNSWNSFQKSVEIDNETVKFSDHDRSNELGIRVNVGSAFKEAHYFDLPNEVYKTSGGIIEAMCCNSINENQVALATGRKGLVFLNWETVGADQLCSDYMWSDSDWPRNVSGGSECTHCPAIATAAVETVGARHGVNFFAKSGRDLAGGGAFGIPGYAGIGALGLGWAEQDYIEIIDPPSTVENICARTLASHPSKPFFLVGSSNAHAYLWEFGMRKARATYGVLSAANASTPHSSASFSSLHFDHYGHRFATAALDGTVCTWQVDVGGRSHVNPTELSVCFNNYASDLAYMHSSGSVIAASGYSTTNINVILWDTLAPPATSQASLVCHEGGVRSVSVLDNGIGPASMSPTIITGGENGDIGLHDFRFIATGKMKRHRRSGELNQKISSIHGTDERASNSSENINGMLWHIPKGHLGSITRVETIPNTSLFFTGSKDGDVKLWDAKRCELIFHWHNLHDKHSFLQSSVRGFGAVVRAAVTDIKVISHGFLTCGGDGTVKRVQFDR